MIKNIVTISLTIFVVALVSILGSAVVVNKDNNNTQLLNQQANNTPTSTVPNNTNIQTPIGNINTGRSSEETEYGDDDEGLSITPAPAPTPTPTPTQTPTPTPTPAPTTKTYTIAQVAQHSVASNCWMIINNKVYNVTSYLSAHPGGVGSMIPYCGKEATVAFDTKGERSSGHSQYASNLLVNYYVGDLIK